MTGSQETSTGIYETTHEKAAEAPENPVWKHPNKDRYIFNTGSSNGWRIGYNGHLVSGKYYYKSKNVHLIL